MRPAPRARLGAAAGGFARRGWSRRERGRQPALPDLLGTARPDGVGCRRIAPGDASTGGCSGLGPVCNGIKHSSARTAAAGWGERGGSHGTGAAGRNTGENGVRACEWGVCVRVCVCVCVCVRGWEGVGRAWRGGGAAVVLGAGASVLTDALKKSRACQPGAVTCSHFKKLRVKIHVFPPLAASRCPAAQGSPPPGSLGLALPLRGAGVTRLRQRGSGQGVCQAPPGWALTPSSETPVGESSRLGDSLTDNDPPPPPPGQPSAGTRVNGTTAAC